jgi:acetyl-CoA/propionyl-CoA carboxylase biotin carboxyl carrier protein
MPEGPGIRVDAGVTADTPLPGAYDPLLAKLMVHAEDRPAAVARLQRALAETAIGGVQTDLSFLRWLVDELGFRAGAYDTGIVESTWQNGPSLSAEERSLAATVARWARAQAPSAPGMPNDGAVAPPSAWQLQARREAVDRRRPR